MRITRLKAAGIAAGAAAFAIISSPALAGSVTITDNDGVDYDPSCLVRNPTAPPATPNSVPSPGTNGACVLGTYDNSMESLDLRTVTMSSAASSNAPSNTKLTATIDVDGAIPAAGSTCNPATAGPGCPDLPDRSFVGAGYKVMFQNPARQNNTPTNSVGGGCPRIPTGQVYDQHSHWLDGYHFFIGFDAVWDGTRWIHSAQIGEYDPAPNGAFFFTELGVNNGGGWTSADPNAVKGVHWDVNTTGIATGTVSVTVDGVLGSADATNCANGVFRTVYAKAGDHIRNIKALSTADATVTLPVTIPLSLIPGESDITSAGGFIYYADMTGCNSDNVGIFGTTLEALGLGHAEGACWTGGPRDTGIPPDTLGNSLACPTPTFGGLLPTNPFHNPSIGCQYDDDNVPVPNAGNPAGPWTAINPGERGTFLSEWWDSNYSFTA